MTTLQLVLTYSAAWLVLGLTVAMAFGKFARVGRNKE